MRMAKQLLHNRKAGTHNIISDVTLDDNLILALRVLAHTAARSKLGCEELGCLFQVDTEQFQTLDVGLMLALCALCALNDDLKSAHAR